LCDKLSAVRGLANVDATRATLDLRAVQARERLQRPVTANFVQETSLDKILSHLARSTNTTIVVDWPALAEQGLSADVPTTLKAAKQPLSEVLALLLGPLGLSWRAIDADTLQITTQTAAASPELELHRVADLLGPKQTAAQLIERIGQSLAPAAGDSNRAPVVVFDQPSGYLLVLASQRDQTQLQSLLEAWRTQESPK
jgi:hypothetical protein